MKYLRRAMRRSKIRKPPSLQIHISSKETSPRCSSVLSDWDADDEGFMSSGDFPPSRPLSLSIPIGPYCPRRPTLQEVLSNTAPPPWTISAFTAYLSQNHCLETLEFTIEADRYTKQYQEMVGRDPNTPVSPQTPDFSNVRILWQKLLDNYITPNAPREVNLPSDIRDHLLSLPCTDLPPDPIALEPAVKIVYELMDESVLVPFLNSVAPSRGPETVSTPWTSNESMSDTFMSGSLDERSLSPAKSRHQRDGSPPSSGTGADALSQSYSGPSTRHSLHSNITGALGLSRLSANLSGASSGEGVESMTDDSTDSPSPAGSALEPMTPPNTPPTSNAEFGDVSPGTSPHTAHSGWKKMGDKLRWKKSRSGHGSGSSTTSVRHPMGREASEEPGL
ncbi:regulator of G protein signaling superfamily [Stipitochalara longipes BDJ]|nr:regulator of G protein signaling superfamily [Stipitochalara longipes BDJ]